MQGPNRDDLPPGPPVTSGASGGPLAWVWLVLSALAAGGVTFVFALYVGPLFWLPAVLEFCFVLSLVWGAAKEGESVNALALAVVGVGACGVMLWEGLMLAFITHNPLLM